MNEREALKLTLAALKQIDEAMPFPVAKLAIMEAEKALAQQDVRDEIDRGAKTLRETYLAQPEQERNALPKAMNVVIAAMQADPGYAWSWHCNIAMAYVDEGVNRDVANQGAARFMKLLANVEPAHDILPTQTPDTKLNEQEPVAWSYWQSCLNDDGTQTAPWVHRLSKFKPDESIINKDVTPLYTTPPQRTWVGLTDDEIDQGLLRSDYAFKTAEAWRAGVVFAMTKLKEKNT